MSDIFLIWHHAAFRFLLRQCSDWPFRLRRRPGSYSREPVLLGLVGEPRPLAPPPFHLPALLPLLPTRHGPPPQVLPPPTMSCLSPVSCLPPGQRAHLRSQPGRPDSSPCASALQLGTDSRHLRSSPASQNLGFLSVGVAVCVLSDSRREGRLSVQDHIFQDNLQNVIHL